MSDESGLDTYDIRFVETGTELRNFVHPKLIEGDNIFIAVQWITKVMTIYLRKTVHSIFAWDNVSTLYFTTTKIWPLKERITTFTRDQEILPIKTWKILYHVDLVTLYVTEKKSTSNPA